MSPNLYLMVVPLIRRNAQPMFNRRSYCNTFTLHPRMAAYTCSSTHAHGTAGTCVRSTGRGTLLISSPPCRFLAGSRQVHELSRPLSQQLLMKQCAGKPAVLR